MTNPGAAVHGEQVLTIAQVAERTGLSTDTLRYYEKAGLIDPVGRTSGNHRVYAAVDLDWLAFLLRLRETGMSIADMQQFAKLRGLGEASVASRLEMLRQHRAALQARLRSLRDNAKALDEKIDHYQQLLDERSERKQS